MCGVVVVFDVKDGGVLVFYFNLSYDLNLFVYGISSSDYKKLLNLDCFFINRII